MNENVSSLLVALCLGAAGLGVVAYPLLSGNHDSMTLGFAITVGAILLVAAMSVASNDLGIGEIVPLRRG